MLVQDVLAREGDFEKSTIEDKKTTNNDLKFDFIVSVASKTAKLPIISQRHHYLLSSPEIDNLQYEENIISIRSNHHDGIVQ